MKKHLILQQQPHLGLVITSPAGFTWFACGKVCQMWHSNTGVPVGVDLSCLLFTPYTSDLRNNSGSFHLQRLRSQSSNDWRIVGVSVVVCNQKKEKKEDNKRHSYLISSAFFINSPFFQSEIFYTLSYLFVYCTPTYTRGRVRLPVESIIHPNTRDGVLALQLVTWITLERHTVSRLLTVSVSRTIHRDARVIAGCCCSCWRVWKKDLNVDQQLANRHHFPCFLASKKEVKHLTEVFEHIIGRFVSVIMLAFTEHYRQNDSLYYQTNVYLTTC